MKKKVLLTKEEYNYLLQNLLKNNKYILSNLRFSTVDMDRIEVYLDKHVADDIRELAGEEVGLHFSVDVKPSEEGWILEHIIDKFYF